MKLKILGIEPAVGQTSKKVYYKVKTDRGDMTVFNEDMVQHLKHAIEDNDLVNLNVVQTEKDGRTYQNIRGFAMDDEVDGKEIEENAYVKPQKFVGVDGDKDHKELSGEYIKKGSAYEKDPVGLAVEVFCKIYEEQQARAREGQAGETETAIMKKAENLVKQAQKAFS